MKDAKRRSAVRRSKGDAAFYAVAYAVVIILLLLVLYPILFVVSASFSSPSAVANGRVFLWPVDFSLLSYESVLQYENVYIGYRNTILYTVLGTAINVSLTMLCAYPLAQKELRGRGFFALIFSFTMVFNGGMIPSYMLISDMGLLNTVWAMVLPGAIKAYNLIVAKTFIQNSIPEELKEAAQIDGCSHIMFFWRMVLPLSKAIIAVLTLYYAVDHWNSYLNAFLYLSDKPRYPLQIFLREILIQNKFDAELLTDEDFVSQRQGLQEILKYSIIVVSTAPILCVYPFVQRYFQKGVMIGSLKG